MSDASPSTPKSPRGALQTPSPSPPRSPGAAFSGASPSPPRSPRNGRSDGASPPSPSRRAFTSPKYSPDTAQVFKLRTMQKTAIHVADIALAAHYEGEITSFRHRTFDDGFQTLKSEFDERIRGLLGYYEQRIRDLESAKQSQLLGFKQQINLDFAKMRERHAHGLAELQREFAVLRLRETQRPAADAEELRCQAQRAALQRDFDRAQDLTEQAEEANQVEMERRYANLDLNLKVYSGQLFQEQHREVEGLVARLAKGVALIESEFLSKRDAESESRDNKFVAELHKCGKRLLALVPPGTDVSAHQRELEELLLGITEAAQLPPPKRLRKGPKTPPRQTPKSPRKS